MAWADCGKLPDGVRNRSSSRPNLDYLTACLDEEPRTDNSAQLTRCATKRFSNSSSNPILKLQVGPAFEVIQVTHHRMGEHFAGHATR